MKIGIDCRLVDQEKNTGISRYTLHLVDYYVARYGSSNIYLITNRIDFSYRSCNVIFTRFKPFNILHFIFWKLKLKALEFDLIHIPFYSGFFGKLKHVKVIMTVHDLMYNTLENFFHSNILINSLKKYYINFIVFFSLRNIDQIISVSKTTQHDLKKLFDFDSAHISESVMLSNDFDDNVLAKNNLNPRGYFLYCGNQRRHKNLAFLLNAFNNSQELPILVLVGPGHSTFKNVLSLGIVTDNELNSLYKNAIAFIFPSKYEGFGLPILESLYNKTSVLASNISAFQEFDSKNVFLFELGNIDDFYRKLDKVITHKFINEESFFENYSQEKIYSQLDSVCVL